MCAFLGYGYYKYHHNASIYEASLPVLTLIQNYLPAPSFSFFAFFAPNTPIDDNNEGIELVSDVEQPLLAHVV